MRWWIFLVSLVSGVSVGAQQLELFTARQGSAPVLQRAQQDGFSDAVLVGVFYAGDVPAAVPLSPRFDLQTGKANYWGYAVRSPARDTLLLYVVVRVPFLGFQVFPVSGIGAIPGISSEPLPSWWMDSDSLVVLLQAEQSFAAFRSRYPDSLPDFVTLGMGMLPGMGSTLPLWTVVFLGSPQEPSTTMTCTAWKASQTQQGAQCLGGPSGVGESTAENLRLFPQPASEWVMVEVAPSDCAGFSVLWLEDMVGRRLQQWRWEGCRRQLKLRLSAGLYALVLSGSRGQLRHLLVVVP